MRRQCKRLLHTYNMNWVSKLSQNLVTTTRHKNIVVVNDNDSKTETMFLYLFDDK